MPLSRKPATPVARRESSTAFTARTPAVPRSRESAKERTTSRAKAPTKATARERVSAGHGPLLGRTAAEPPHPAMGFVAATANATTRETGFIRYGGESHLMTFGATGSSKTSMAICTALEHPGAFISFECKGDIFRATAPQRLRMGHAVYLLDLSGNDALLKSVPGCRPAAFNVFDVFKQIGGEQALFARECAVALAEPVFSKDPFWDQSAQTTIAASIGAVLGIHADDQPTMGKVFDLLSNDDVTYTLAVMMDTQGDKLDRASRSGIAALLQMPDTNTRPSVLATVHNHLRLFESDTVRAWTDTTTFDLDTLIAGGPIALYIVAPPLRLATYAPLIRLWLDMLLRLLMTRVAAPEHRTLMMVDEVGALGRIDALVTASTLLRSYGLQLWTLFQNAAQLDVYLHHARTMVDNAGVIQLLGVSNLRAATDFADLVGGVDPQDVVEMRDDEALMLVDGGRPQWIRKVRYFDEPTFARLVTPPAR